VTVTELSPVFLRADVNPEEVKELLSESSVTEQSPG